MCLVLKSSLFKRTKRISLRDITCYKLVTLIPVYNDDKCFIGHLENQFKTLYQLATVELGKTYKSKLKYERPSYYCHVVEDGLHSYATYEDAHWASIRNPLMRIPNPIVVKCIIPVGSWYYVGRFDLKKSYASSKLKYVEIIKK